MRRARQRARSQLAAARGGGAERGAPARLVAMRFTRRRSPLLRSSPVLVALCAAALLVIGGCTPGTAAIEPAEDGRPPPAQEAAPAFDTPAAREVERAAQVAFHRMEIGRLRLGVYTTNVLVDLDLPRGARVTVEAFGDDDYRLRFTSDAALEAAWLVTPRGVERTLL